MKKLDNVELKKRIVLNNKFHDNDIDGVLLEFDYLQRAEVTDLTLEHSNLSSLYILENIFTRCDMDDINFSGSAFNGSVFHNCNFRNCSFRKSELQPTQFENCKFENCDFSRSELLDCKIICTQFLFCNFRGIHLCDSNMRDVIFSIWTDDMVLLQNNTEENVKRLR